MKQVQLLLLDSLSFQTYVTSISYIVYNILLVQLTHLFLAINDQMIYMTSL